MTLSVYERVLCLCSTALGLVNAPGYLSALFLVLARENMAIDKSIIFNSFLNSTHRDGQS